MCINGAVLIVTGAVLQLGEKKEHALASKVVLRSDDGSRGSWSNFDGC